MTNYNKTFGGRKYDVPSGRNHFRIVLIVILVGMIITGLAAIFTNRFAKNRPAEPVVAAASPVVSSESAVPTAPKLPTAASVQTAAVPATTPSTASATPVAAGVKDASGNAATPSVPATLDPAIDKLLNQAEAAFNSDKCVEAKKLVSQALAACKTEKQPEWLAAAKLLSKINIKIFTSDCPYPEKKMRYEVMAGDALQRIARRFNTTIEAIQASNGLKSFDNIMDGQTLIIYKGDWKIRVSKKDFRLYLMDGDELFKMYNITIGRQGRTPTGNFQVQSKISNPDWYSPQGKVPFGSKENVLGTRWLKLQPMDPENRNLRGYGIHGTWERDSIGKDRSNGCIRMLNEDVEELFSIIPLKTAVVIED